MPSNPTSLFGYLNQLRPLFTRRDKFRYLGLLALMAIGAALDFLGLGMIPAFVALLAAPERLEAVPVLGEWVQRAGGAGATSVYFAGGGLLLGLFAAKAIYFAWMYRLQFRLLAHHRVSIAERLFRAYMSAPWTFHLRHNSAELMRNIAHETTEIINGVLMPFLSVALGTMMTVMIGALVVIALPWQSWIAFAVLAAVSGVLMGRIRHKLTAVGQAAKHERRMSVQAVNEGLAALMDARILGKEAYLVRRFAQSMTRFALAERYRNTVRAVFPYVLETIAVAGLLLILWLLLASAPSVNEILPQLALVGAAVVRLRQTVATIFSGLGQIHFSKVAIEHVAYDIQSLEGLSKAQERRSAKADRTLTFEREIRFENVSFRYAEVDYDAVTDLNLTIQPGQSVALVGATGSGKTTAINLLLGLLEPTSGQILVDGQSVAEDPAAWQGQIGYVPQTVNLLDDTIRRNIAFGVPDEEVDEARLQEVLRIAQLTETVAGFQDGVQTVVGERGLRISGGQRQRLGIARALYHAPRVLVMDEGTSALDSATEAALVNCLRALDGRVTMVFVAHRLTTVKHCRQICFLKDGHVAGTGRHEDLLQSLPEYRALHLVSTSTQELSVPGVQR